MQAEIESWPLAMRDAGTRSPELAERSVSGATRPPRKRGTKRSIGFRLACCITSKLSLERRLGAEGPE
jgi:hypothetical protein